MVKGIQMGIVLLMVCALPNSAMSKGMSFGKWWDDPKMSEQLNLTDKEKADLDEQYVESQRKLIELKSSVERERFELDTLLEKEKLDEDATNNQFMKLEKARNSLSAEYFKFILQSRKILGKERFRDWKMKRKMARRGNPWKKDHSKDK